MDKKEKYRNRRKPWQKVKRGEKTALLNILFTLEKALWKNRGGCNPHYHLSGSSPTELRLYRCIFMLNRAIHRLSISLALVLLLPTLLLPPMPLKTALICIDLTLIVLQLPLLALQREHFRRLDRIEELNKKHREKWIEAMAEKLGAELPPEISEEDLAGDLLTLRFALHQLELGSELTFRPMDLPFLQRFDQLLAVVGTELEREDCRNTPGDLPQTRYARKAQKRYGTRKSVSEITFHSDACRVVWERRAAALQRETLEMILQACCRMAQGYEIKDG